MILFRINFVFCVEKKKFIFLSELSGTVQVQMHSPSLHKRIFKPRTNANSWQQPFSQESCLKSCLRPKIGRWFMGDHKPSRFMEGSNLRHPSGLCGGINPLCNGCGWVEIENNGDVVLQLSFCLCSDDGAMKKSLVCLQNVRQIT